MRFGEAGVPLEMTNARLSKNKGYGYLKKDVETYYKGLLSFIMDAVKQRELIEYEKINSIG